MCVCVCVCVLGAGIPSLFCNVVLSVLSSLAIILLRKRKMVAADYNRECVYFLCLFLGVPWVGLWSVTYWGNHSTPALLV